MRCTNETFNSPKSVFLDIFLHVEFTKDTKMTDNPTATPLTECARFFSGYSSGHCCRLQGLNGLPLFPEGRWQGHAGTPGGERKRAC